MLKQVVALIILSVGIIASMPYAQQGIQYLLNAHDLIAQVLSNVFSGGQAGTIAKSLIALLSLPIIIGFVPAMIYWFVRRSFFPYFMEIVWIVWLIQAGALLMVNTVVG